MSFNPRQAASRTPFLAVAIVALALTSPLGSTAQRAQASGGTQGASPVPA
jgi:hypothetical protein